jgi:hypothetical protein
MRILYSGLECESIIKIHSVSQKELDSGMLLYNYFACVDVNPLKSSGDFVYHLS